MTEGSVMEIRNTSDVAGITSPLNIITKDRDSPTSIGQSVVNIIGETKEEAPVSKDSNDGSVSCHVVHLDSANVNNAETQENTVSKEDINHEQAKKDGRISSTMEVVDETKEQEEEEEKENEDPSDDDDAPPPKLRTVNDYEDEEELRRALWTRMDGTVVEPRRSSNTKDFDETKIDEENADGDDDDSTFSQMEDALLKEEHNELDPEFEWVITNLDAETSVEQSLEEELRRLQVLKSYLLLDAKPEPAFEHLTALATRMYDVPIALVSLVDLGRAWFMSNRGLGDVRQIPRRAFCSHAILSTQDLLIVPNTHEDIRFKDSLVVANPPYIGFYAGCPLVSPEGVKLGTFCLLDTKPRNDIMSNNLNDKANLREMTKLTMDLIVKRRREQLFHENDKTKMIACVAHDLLTPLSGVQMSLSLLKDDCADDLEGEFKMTPEEQRDLIDTAHNCAEMMGRICHDTIETCRAEIISKKEAFAMTNKANSSGAASSNDSSSGNRNTGEKSNATTTVRPKLKDGHTIISLKDLIKHITLVMEPYPKKVPLYVTLDPALPGEFVSNDLKVFRSIINYLTNACKHTQVGCVHLRILLKEDKEEKSWSSSKSGSRGSKDNKFKKMKKMIVFEVEDTGKGVPKDLYPMLFRPFRDAEEDGCDGELAKTAWHHSYNTCLAGGCDYIEEETPGLGLYSVATNIGSMGGSYGFRPRETLVQDMTLTTDENKRICPLTLGSIFWFSLPFVKPPPPSKTNMATISAATNKFGRDDASASATAASIVQSITDSFKTRPVRGNVRVCETVPRSAFYQKQIQQPRSKKQYQQQITGQEQATKRNKEKQSNGYENKYDQEVTVSAKKLISCKKKVLITAKRLCSGRFNSSHSSITSLSNGDGIKVTLTLKKSGGRRKNKKTVSSLSLPYKKAFHPTLVKAAEEDADNSSQSTTHSSSDTTYQTPVSMNLTETNPALIESNHLSASTISGKSHFENDDDEEWDNNDDEEEKESHDSFVMGGSTMNHIKNKLLGLSTSQVDVIPQEEPKKVQRIPKALVIDDSTVIRKTLNRALTTLGFEVTLATNGMEGLQKLQQTKFDVTFCDFLMPVMDGLDCVQQFRSLEADRNASSVDGGGCYRQYIIGISAHASDLDVERGIEAGMDHFMCKPVPLKALKDLMQSEKMIHIRHTLDEMMACSVAKLSQHRRWKSHDSKWNERGHFSNSNTGDSRSVEHNNCNNEIRRRDKHRRNVHSSNRHENGSNAKPTCLVAEDSSTIARVLKHAIEEQGWNVVLASDGAMALQKLQQRNYDLVLMDDSMPKISGTQCMELFRSWERYNRVSTQKHVVWMSEAYVPPPEGCEQTLSLCPPSYPTHLYDGAMSKPVLMKDLYTLLEQATSDPKRNKNENLSSDIMVR